MKEKHHSGKKCGELRVVCGEIIPNYQQRNCFGSNMLERLRVVAGKYLYPYVHTHARTRAHVIVPRYYYPHFPATGVNSLNDSRLACGELTNSLPAETPQFAGSAPAARGWAS